MRNEQAQAGDLALFSAGVADEALGAPGQSGPEEASYPALPGAGLAAVAVSLRPAPSYAYNADGDRTKTTTASGAAVPLSYDQANRLVGYGTAAAYAYNGDGLLASVTTAGATRQLSYDTTGGPSPRLIDDGSNYYVYGAGGLPVEQISSTGATYYYQHDALGSTTALTDSSAAVVGTFSYSSYGALASHTGTVATPLGFAGAYTDPASGLIYLTNRYYDPTTAQFISVDPLVGLTQVPYGYAGDDPIDNTDPLGLCGFNPFCYVTGAAEAVGGSFVTAGTAVGSGFATAGSAVGSGFATAGTAIGSAGAAVGIYAYHHPLQTVGYVAGAVAAATGVGALADAGILGLTTESLGVISEGASLVGTVADIPGCASQFNFANCAGLFTNATSFGLGIGGSIADEDSLLSGLFKSFAPAAGIGGSLADLVATTGLLADPCRQG